MKQKMFKLIGLLKTGDRKMLAKKAGVSAATLTKVVNGEKDISNFPSLATVFMEYIVKREQELVAQQELNSRLNELYEKIDIDPPTEEDILLSKPLTYISINRMNKENLLTVITKKGMKITGTGKMDLEELQDEVIAYLDLED